MILILCNDHYYLGIMREEQDVKIGIKYFLFKFLPKIQKMSYNPRNDPVYLRV